jgi:prepilin-type N-terminal cleavage/methylation domain-containing protein
MKKGFTLIEIIISILILSFVTISIGTLFLLTGDTTNNVLKLNDAEKLCVSQIEYLKSVSSDSALLMNNTIHNYNTIPDYKNFKREIFVQQYFSGDTSLLKLSVNVKWKTAFNENKMSLCGVNFYE